MTTTPPHPPSKHTHTNTPETEESAIHEMVKLTTVNCSQGTSCRVASGEGVQEEHLPGGGSSQEG
jgi:hypothetical protein